VQSIDRFAPAIVVDQIVPLRDQILDRATGSRLTEWDAAVHATSALFSQVLYLGRRVNLVIVIDSDYRQTPRNFLSVELFKSGGFAHEPISIQ
jgi:hypothetical protein